MKPEILSDGLTPFCPAKASTQVEKLQARDDSAPSTRPPPLPPPPKASLTSTKRGPETLVRLTR